MTINNEGLIQKVFKTTTAPTNARNSDDFLKSLIFLQKDANKKKKITIKELFLLNPFLNLLNKKRDQFYFNIFSFNKNYKIKVSFIHQKQSLSLKNFYLTDNLIKNSKIMSECNLFYTNFSNFN